jgi:RNA polymerase sigma-70 factor (ECF subfamily)
VGIPRDQERGVSEEPWDEEKALVDGLQAGDATAFAALVDGLHGRLLAFARTFTSSPALAQDIVQETWLGVIRGMPRFEGRSSIRTWIFSILVRRARTMTAQEARRREVSAGAGELEAGSPTEWSPGLGRVGLWEEPLVSWGLEDPEATLRREEALRVVQEALNGLPEQQRQVVLLRDVEGVRAAEVCNILGVSETNQRVLLHRGRARIRRALDQLLRDGLDRQSPEIQRMLRKGVR